MQQNNIRWLIGEYGSHEVHCINLLPSILTLWGRPLPEAMFNYARSDTHFLLYIYDNMRNELINKSNASQENDDLIGIVMDRSKEEALQRYERPFYDGQRGSGPLGWYNMLCRTPALFNREQFAVFRAIHQWRDQIARKEDESVHFIMPKNVLYNLAREMPVDMPSLLGSSHPMSRSYKIHKSEVLAVIRRARTLSYNEPDMQELMHTMQPVTADRFSKTNGRRQVLPDLASTKMALLPQLQRNSSGLPARSRNSRFWGSTIPNNADRRMTPLSPRKNLCLKLPMPRLSAEISEDMRAAGASTSERPQTSPGAHAEHQYMKQTISKADEGLNVKEAEVSRKRKATDSSEFLNSVFSIPKSNATDHTEEHTDEVNSPVIRKNQELVDRNTRVLSERKEGKRTRRVESKRLDKECFQGDEYAKSQRSREVEPFDYANAPSVLHASRGSSWMTTGKEISPYTKSSDAPKGMRKAKKEQEGRSLTFKF